MRPEIVTKILKINKQFYQNFATDFSQTRQRLQPGVLRVLDALPNTAKILDLGCGNGNLAVELAHRNFSGQYVGLDFSPNLLSAAPPNMLFLERDLSAPDWDADLPAVNFDVVVAFAVFHHLPGWDLRRRVMRQVYQLLPPDGIFVHSHWQFLNSPRLRARIQPWERVGISGDDVEDDDYLLDWRRGGEGLRYVHRSSEQELLTLSQQANFALVESFYSDGAGGQLGLYQKWVKNGSFLPHIG